jgi:YidC/Oxa1 family membrane protein insertase
MLPVTANIFQPLIDVFEAVLKFFHNSIGVPWGWSIVLLTVVIRALLIPLAIKQYHSMQRLQAHMPELKKIQEKYKDDKQRQQQEVMKFYQENKVNPFGSCLPLAAQLPVFIGLFYMLRTSLRVDICPAIQRAHQGIPPTAPINHSHLVPCGSHGASFLFIHDLTTNATGVTLLVLIVLYVGTQLASSLLMTTAQMERNQRLLMLAMPLFFVIFVINFPAGVLVYWITTNLWTMGQQYVIRRRLGPMGGTPAVAGGTGSGGGGGVTDGGGRDGASGPAPSGGLGGLLRGGRPKADADDGGASTKTATRPRTREAPPPPPRKKKKRSGRRR